MTADMGSATLPQLLFSYNGYNLNLMSGYVKQMDITSMRDNVTPVVNNRVTLIINDYGNTISSVEYHVYTLNGEQELKSEMFESPAKNTVFSLEDPGLMDEERCMRLDLKLESGKMVYYYTRIKDATDTRVLNNLDYINTFFETEMGRNEDESFSIGDDLETNVLADAYTFQHVDITSDKSYVSWGELEPEVVGGVRYEMKELNNIYTSVLMEYQVRCVGEENPFDFYDVSEFFRVRTIDGKTYLLNYDRTMEQIFSYSDKVLDEKGILLGITGLDLNYDVNDNGTIVNFVQAGELWNYDKKQDKLSLLFSFSDGESTDARNLNTEHQIEIINTSKNGDTTFAVYGYMNRGEHEGEVGAAFYFFDKGKNTVEEKAFVASNLSGERCMEQLDAMLYYSVENQAVYVMADGTLYRYSVFFESTDKILENLKDKQYAVASDVRWVAYQKADSEEAMTNKLTVMDLEDESTREISVDSDEIIWPLGFIGNDIVYGVSKKSVEEYAENDQKTMPMYKLVIESPEGKILKTYEEQGIFIASTEFNDNMVAINRVAKHGNSYMTIAPDYIMNNEEKKNSNITAEVYYGDKKLTQMRLSFEDGIQDQKPKILKPKHVLYESSVSLPYGIRDAENRDCQFYVYGNGKLCGSYSYEGAAIRAADKCSGVVVAEDQSYIWEKGNRDLKYYCEDENLIRKIVRGLKSGKSPVEVIGALNDGKYMDLTGCKAEELLYIINNRGPVIAMLSPAEYAVFIGYGDGEITYIDIADKKGEEDAEKEKELSELDVLTNSCGNIYYGF